MPAEKIYLQPARLVRWLADEAITICDVPTLLAESILAETPPAGSRLRALVTGGDRLRRRPPAGFPWPLYDQYGPTENTVVSTIARVEPEGAPGPLHIGKPIANHRVRILDAKGEPVAPGEIGEIHLGGIGLARGYLGAGADAERFFADPFAEIAGERLYRTGDLGRLLPDGNLQYVGRVDQQVKIRGFRVELAEIEQRLGEHPGVREALAQAVELPGGAKRIVAHYVRRPGADPPRAELRAFLSDRVPHFMVPTWLVAVPEWPRTGNGKIDRAALVASDDWRHARDAAPVPPRNAVDARLAAIWSELLDVPAVGITDDFFELGGHSLAAAQVASRLEREMAADLPLALFFQAPTIEALSDHLRGVRPIVTTPGLVPLTPSGSRPPLFFLPGLGGHVLSFRALAQALGADQPCFGLQDPALEGEGEPFATVEQMAEHFVDLVRSVNADGPPHLVGYSLGGLVAIEMGRRLLRAGSAPPFVALIDTPAPGFPPRLPFLQRLAAHGGNLVRGGAAGRRAYLAARWSNVVARFRGRSDALRAGHLGRPHAAHAGGARRARARRRRLHRVVLRRADRAAPRARPPQLARDALRRPDARLERLRHRSDRRARDPGRAPRRARRAPHGAARDHARRRARGARGDARGLEPSRKPRRPAAGSCCGAAHFGHLARCRAPHARLLQSGPKARTRRLPWVRSWGSHERRRRTALDGEGSRSAASSASAVGRPGPV